VLLPLDVPNTVIASHEEISWGPALLKERCPPMKAKYYGERQT